MSPKKISSGVVHEVPADLRKMLTSDPKALSTWEDITPLARNEWICWIESAKKVETRTRRIEWGLFQPEGWETTPLLWARMQTPLTPRSFRRPPRPRTGVGKLPISA